MKGRSGRGTVWRGYRRGVVYNVRTSRIREVGEGRGGLILPSVGASPKCYISHV